MTQLPTLLEADGCRPHPEQEPRLCLSVTSSISDRVMCHEVPQRVTQSGTKKCQPKASGTERGGFAFRTWAWGWVF